jgi:hypothetical protein
MSNEYLNNEYDFNRSEDRFVRNARTSDYDDMYLEDDAYFCTVGASPKHSAEPQHKPVFDKNLFDPAVFAHTAVPSPRSHGRIQDPDPYPDPDPNPDLSLGGIESPVARPYA